MKKFLKILIVPIALTTVFGFASNVLAAPLEVEFNPDPLFSESNFLPADDTESTVTVTNNSEASQTILTEAINVFDNDNLGTQLIMTIKEGSVTLYNDTLANFFGAGEVSLGEIDSSIGSTRIFTYHVAFTNTNDNSYQGKSLGFDVCIGFQGGNTTCENTTGPDENGPGDGIGGDGDEDRGPIITGSGSTGGGGGGTSSGIEEPDIDDLPTGSVLGANTFAFASNEPRSGDAGEVLGDSAALDEPLLEDNLGAVVALSSWDIEEIFSSHCALLALLILILLYLIWRFWLRRRYENMGMLEEEIRNRFWLFFGSSTLTAIIICLVTAQYCPLPVFIIVFMISLCLYVYREFFRA